MARWLPRDHASGPAAVLLALEAEAAAVAAGGEQWAAALLAQVRSWLDMLAVAGDDGDIGELFVIFAAEGRARMDEWWTVRSPP